MTFLFLKEERSVAAVMYVFGLSRSRSCSMHTLIWGAGAGGVTQSTRPPALPDVKALPSLESAHTSRRSRLHADYKELCVSLSLQSNSPKLTNCTMRWRGEGGNSNTILQVFVCLATRGEGEGAYIHALRIGKIVNRASVRLR